MLSPKGNKLTKSYSKLIGALAAVVFTTTATASVCTNDSYAITAAAPAGVTPVSLSKPINATSCIGVNAMIPGSNPASFGPDANLGYSGDGLMNGEGGLVPWNTFISPSQLQDLNPATQGAVDPGWIQLSTIDANGTSTSSIKTANGVFDLGSTLSFRENTTNTTTGGGMAGGIAGTWALTLNPNIISILHSNGLFSRNNFDQLAFVVKAGNNWAVYDFDFTKSTDLASFDLNTPYSLSGTWNLNDFRNPRGNADQKLSFLSVWARDPAAAADVPEPAMLTLFGAGLLSMAGLRRRRKAK